MKNKRKNTDTFRVYSNGKIKEVELSARVIDEIMEGTRRFQIEITERQKRVHFLRMI